MTCTSLMICNNLDVDLLTTLPSGRICRAEFCWECLAPWNRINFVGQYHRDGHNEDCWFRRNELQPPELNGNDLQEALREHENELG
jgi:hypothetical protein